MGPQQQSTFWQERGSIVFLSQHFGPQQTASFFNFSISSLFKAIANQLITSWYLSAWTSHDWNFAYMPLGSKILSFKSFSQSLKSLLYLPWLHKRQQNIPVRQNIQWIHIPQPQVWAAWTPSNFLMYSFHSVSKTPLSFKLKKFYFKIIKN